MDVKKFLPHVISVVILLAVAAFFFAPNAFSGKVLPQGDNQKALGMQAELREYEKKDGRMPLWTNSAFSGMPAYQVNMTVNGNLTNTVGRALFLWGDYTSLWKLAFTAMFCMYLLLVVLRMDWRVALFGAVAFGITTYNVDILEAGHTTKMRALALAPGVLAGLAVLLNGRWLLGGGLLALFLALQINANHVQITYYTLLLVGIFFLADLAQSIRHKALLHWGRNAGVGALAIGLAFASNLSRLWPTYEYGQETIRGRSELSQRAGKGDGLDVDYLFGWSYGKA
jgi:hypothetical protein